MSLMVRQNSSTGGSSCQDLALIDESKKHNHSEIEKRRRDKMNHYIAELSCLIPMCNAISRKLDKLTVLRMAVQHMKTIKGNMNAFASGGQMKPAFLSDEALLELILQGELLGQNWFDILHPKDVAKVKEQLSSSDLSPKERLIDAKTMLPVKTGPSPSTQANMCPGARRSFFCRMKFKSIPRVKEEYQSITGYAQKRRKSHNSDRKYCVIHCIGYLKSWISTKMNVSEESEAENDLYNMSCLVAIGCTLPNFNFPTPYKPDIQIKPINFSSRHTIDGKFLFVDQRATLILGYLPQELLGTCCYEYCHPEDLKILAESHRLGLQSNGEEKAESGKYRFKVKSGSYIYLKTSWKTFKNPWTKEFEFLIAINCCVFDREIMESSNDSDSVKSGVRSSNSTCSGKWNTPTDQGTSSAVDEILFRIKDSCANKSSKSNGANGGGNVSSNEQTSTGYSSNDTKSVQKMLASSRVALWKIGRYIADEVLENQRRNEETTGVCNSFYSSSPASNDPANYTTETLMDSLNKWKSDRKELKPLISNDPMVPVSNMWSPSGPSASMVDSQPQSTAAECCSTGGDITTDNGACILMDTNGHVSNGKNSTLMYPPCPVAANYDPIMTDGSCSNRERQINRSGSVAPSDGNVTFYHHQSLDRRLPWAESGNHTASGSEVEVTSEVLMKECDHQAQYNTQIPNSVDQENEDAAMDLIMSILEADTGLGGPVNPGDAPCPWV